MPTSPAADSPGSRWRWKWVLLGLILTAAIVSFYYVSFRNFRKTIVSSFNTQQTVIARSVQNLLEYHLVNAYENLDHSIRMVRRNHGSTTAITHSIDSVLQSHQDDFLAISIVSDGEILHTVPEGLRANIETSVLQHLQMAGNLSGPYLSERSISGNKATSHLFVPFRIAGDDTDYYIVGSLDLKAFINDHLPTWKGQNLSFLLADYEGDVYVISDSHHESHLLMEMGNIFRIEGSNCGNCHADDQFDDIRLAVRTGDVVHAIQSSPDQRLYNRTTVPVVIYHETWTVSVRSPYDDIQGAVDLSFRKSVIYTIFSLLLVGGFGLALHSTQKSRAVLEERTLAEKGIRESEEKYRALFDGSNDAIYILQLSGKDPSITSANLRAVEMLGYDSLDHLLRASPQDFLPLYQHDGKLSSAILNVLWGRAREGRVQTVELIHCKLDGTEFPCELTVSPIQIGNQAFLQAVLRDITERKKADTDRLRIDKLKSISTLAGGIAHDFNNLLAGIMGNIGLTKLLLKTDPSNMVELRATLDTAEKACDKAAALTKRMLSFAEKSTEPFRRKISNLEEIVREDASMALHGSNVAAEYHFNHSLLPVHADPDQIGQVIHNLVKNAREAMPRGGVVRISADNEFVSSHPSLESGNYIKVTIHDEGEGVPENSMGRIFDAYYSTKEEGQGLGLSSVQNIIHQHGGFIEFSSTVGRGTTFILRLPSGDDVVPEPAEQSVEQPIQGKGEKILIIDDNNDVGDSIRKTVH
jgi:PAS domain S-box-containing protein